MIFSCQLYHIQHIKELNFSVDLSSNQLMCIVGKNGVGKTTLVEGIGFDERPMPGYNVGAFWVPRK